MVGESQWSVLLLRGLNSLTLGLEFLMCFLYEGSKNRAGFSLSVLKKLYLLVNTIDVINVG